MPRNAKGATPASSPRRSTMGLSPGLRYLGKLDRKGPALLALIALILVAAVCTAFGASIRIDTRLRALLPEDTPSLEALNQVTQAKGATDQLTIALQGPNAEQTQRLGRALSKELRQWPEAEGLTFELDLTPFRDRLLYWMELEDLRGLSKALVDAKAQAVAEQARPGLSDVQIPGQAVLVDEDNWDTEYEDSEQKQAPAKDERFAEKDPPQSLPERIEALRQDFLGDPRLRRSQAEAIWPKAWTKAVLEDPAANPPWPATVSTPVQNTDGTIALITARMTRPPTDVAFVRELQTRFQAALAKVKSELPPDDSTRAQLVGSYAISGDVDMIMKDLRYATALSIALVVLVLLLGFGTWRALVVVVTPVFVSMGITLGLAKIIFGELNVLTAFLFAVLFGMGVDFSVHLYMQRLRGAKAEGWAKRIAAHLRPLLSTMLTTAGALLALCFGEFQAFREFGLISAIGVSTCFLAALVVVPALDTLLGLPKTKASETRPDTTPLSLARLPRLSLVALALLVCALGLPHLAFETNTRNLRAPPNPEKVANTIPYGEAQGQDRTSVPTILYSEDPEQLQAAVQALQSARKAKETSDAWVKSVMSVSTLLPADQSAKGEELKKIHTLSEGLLAQSDRYQPALRALSKLSQAEPVRPQDLPDWTIAPFSTKDGQSNRMAHAHLRFAAHDLNEIQDVVHKLRTLLAPFGVMAATTSFVFADLGQLITLDSQRLPAIALGVIALCLLVDLRRLGPTLACILTLVTGLALSLALLGLFGIRINFFNLAVLPAVIGLGIDASIHLWHARGKRLGATGRASLVAGATTCAAFAGLLAASHPGLRSMAHVGLISIIACVGTAFLLLAGWPGSSQDKGHPDP